MPDVRCWTVIADIDISPVAALLGDTARARIVQALLGGRALPAGELARHAGVGAPTASAHLAKLVDGGLLTVTRSGRHRYFEIANAEVSRAVEALAAIAPPSLPHSLRQATVGEALAAARTCYDHLAGSLGVTLTDALLERGALSQTDEGFALGPQAKAIARDTRDRHRHPPSTPPRSPPLPRLERAAPARRGRSRSRNLHPSARGALGHALAQLASGEADRRRKTRA